MLGKLIKYEFKATGRTFLPLYGLLLVVALIHRFLGRDNREMFQELNKVGDFATIALVALFIALAVMTLVVTVQRFQKNLLKDEGYLMFTLPTTTRKLIASKAIVAITWVVISTLVGGVTFFILFSEPMVLQLIKDVWNQLSILIAEIELRWVIEVVQMIAFILLGYLGFLAIIYLSLSIGQFAWAQKHRTLVSIGSFIGINFILGWLQNMISTQLIPQTMSFNTVMFISNCIWLVGVIGMLEITNYILKKHLNLE